MSLWKIYAFFQDLFFKYTWNNFLHLQVELCVAAILRPCAHEMRLQPGLGSQDKFKPHQDASQEQTLTETPTSEPSITPENSAHNLMVTHVGVSVCVQSRRLMWYLIYWMGHFGGSHSIKTADWLYVFLSQVVSALPPCPENSRGLGRE